MADVVQHPRLPKNSKPSDINEKRAEARSILAAPKLDIDAATDMVAEMYDRSALPAPPDVKAYLRALAQALADYPAPIGQQCCDPRTGVTRRCRWRPEVTDVLDYCDGRMKFYGDLAADPRRPEPIKLAPAPSAEDVEHVRLKAREVAESCARILRRRTAEFQAREARESLQRLMMEASIGGPRITASEELTRSLKDAPPAPPADAPAADAPSDDEGPPF